MTPETFIGKLNTLLSIAHPESDSSWLLQEGISAMTYYDIVVQLQKTTQVKTPIITKTLSEGDLRLHIPRLTEFPIIIKSEYRDEANPPIYVEGTNKVALLTADLSMLLLIIAAAALADAAVHTHRQYNLKCYPLLRKHFNLYGYESDYPNKIQLHKELACYAVVFAEDESIIFVAKDVSVLEEVKATLQLVPAVKPQSEMQVFPSQFLLQGVVREGILSGFICLPEAETPVAASFETDNGQDFNQMLDRSQKLIGGLTRDVLKEIEMRAAKDVTDAAYEQSDHIPTAIDYERITDAIQLEEIRFYDEDLVFVFAAVPAVRDKKIYVQTDYQLEIDDLYVAD